MTAWPFGELQGGDDDLPSTPGGIFCVCPYLMKLRQWCGMRALQVHLRGVDSQGDADRIPRWTSQPGYHCRLLNPS